MSSESERLKNIRDELKWVRIKEESENSFVGKTRSKAMTNPLVPIGVLATVGILVAGLRSFNRRDQIQQQKYMRYRVLAQGLTLVAAIGGMFLSGAFK